VLDATLNQMGDHPMAKQPWAGFDATTTLLRSDFDMGQFAPFVGDEVTINISIEAMVPAQ
jgi:polyisoprenoid-binding protein YceI